MKLLKHPENLKIFKNRKRSIIGRISGVSGSRSVSGRGRKSATGSGSMGGVRIPFQKSGNDAFLKNLMAKRRGKKTPQTVFRKYGRILKILLPVLLLFFGILYLLKYVDEKGLLDIKEVEVSGAAKFVNYNDLKNLVETNTLGKKITSIDTSKLEKTLQENFLGAKVISVQRSTPNKLKVVVDERVPVALLDSVTLGKIFLIDIDGYVLGEVDDSYSGLPEVKYSGNVYAGSFINKEMVPLTIEILEISKKKELSVNSISFYPKYTRLYVGSGTEVLLSNSKELEKNINIASYLVKKSLLEAKKLSKIDLRYDKVIVSYD